MDARGEEILDISVALSESTVIYPGDPAPEMMNFSQASGGAACNTGMISFGLHNGMHVDAPYHFF
jgi:arylformamidase